MDEDDQEDGKTPPPSAEPALTEERLRRLQDLASVGRVGAGVTHEVRNIMTAILGFTQVAKMKLTTTPARAKEMLDMIEQESARCLELLHGFLGFSKHSGTSFSRVEVNALVDSVARIVRPQLKVRGDVKLELRLTDGLPPVRARLGQLQQVVLNLALNAHQAVGPGGKVILSTRPGALQGTVEIVVSDNGPGVAPADRQKIFQAFYTTRDTGTGLGLALALAIAREHGGTLMLADAVPGQGAEFVLQLPAVGTAVEELGAL